MYFKGGGKGVREVEEYDFGDADFGVGAEGGNWVGGWVGGDVQDYYGG